MCSVGYQSMGYSRRGTDLNYTFIRSISNQSGILLRWFPCFRGPYFDGSLVAKFGHTNRYNPPPALGLVDI